MKVSTPGQKNFSYKNTYTKGLSVLQCNQKRSTNVQLSKLGLESGSFFKKHVRMNLFHFMQFSINATKNDSDQKRMKMDPD